MKKQFLTAAIIAMTLTLCFAFTACSGPSFPAAPPVDAEGIRPYALSEKETKLLRSLGLDGKVSLVSFKAPAAAKSLEINAYVLQEDNTWKSICHGGVSLGNNPSPEEKLEGDFAILLEDDYSLTFNAITMGQAEFKTEKINMDFEIMASSRTFLDKFQEIELDQEIPVAILVYDSGNSLRVQTTDSYFELERFEGMDLVQAVTLTFSEDAEM